MRQRERESMFVRMNVYVCGHVSMGVSSQLSHFMGMSAYCVDRLSLFSSCCFYLVILWMVLSRSHVIKFMHFCFFLFISLSARQDFE